MSVGLISHTGGESMKYCKICGAQLADGSRFCTRCGFACEPAAEQPVTCYRPAKTEEEPPVFVAEEIPASEPRKRLLTAVLISLLVVGCMVALFFIRTAVLNQKGGSTLGDALGGNGREEEQEQADEAEEPEVILETHRLLSNTKSTEKGQTTEENYTYDEQGNILSYTKTSFDEYGWERNSSYVYTYDDENRLAHVSMDMGSDLFEGTYTWNRDIPVNCLVVGESEDENVMVWFETDDNGNIIAVYLEYEDGSSRHVADAVYDEHGCMTVLTIYADGDDIFTRKFDGNGRLIVVEHRSQGITNTTVYEYYRDGSLRSEAYYEGGLQTYMMEYSYTDDPVPVPESVTMIDGWEEVTLPFTVEEYYAKAVLPGETENTLFLKLDGQGHTVGRVVVSGGEIVTDETQTFVPLQLPEGEAPSFLFDPVYLHVFAEYT